MPSLVAHLWFHWRGGDWTSRWLELTMGRRSTVASAPDARARPH